MNSLLRIPYAVAGSLAHALVRVVPRGTSKFQRGLNARRGIVERYERWAATSRDPTRPLVWVHAPSVGEGLQAQPVIELMRTRRPDVQIAYTFYSPSAESLSQSLKVDFADYLPFDTFADADAIIAALRPSAIVFSKLDIWPALTEQAAVARVPVGVISATLAESSGRRGLFARALLTDAYRVIERVGAIDEEDADHFRQMGVRAERIEVTGDTRYDQVWKRARRAPSALVESMRSSRPTLVAGSTWPADEEHLFSAWRNVRDKIPDARLVIAPHELTAAHLVSVERSARRRKLSLARMGADDAANADVVLVDRYGILGDLYALADVAYVGGGFHSAGLHSVLEPAAFGAPVLFGPRHDKSRDARKLIEAAGGAAVTGVADLSLRLNDWLGSLPARDVAGEAARSMVQAGTGAGERSFGLVSALLGR
ncbi:MAG: 3-deoxy-D-manno-octulosonic-acid transferase [Thermoanaerobaculia bacterium]|nr:3-deoxy-D-manno-octulosonic-acid transferase [Thermoanaerobaculia bacterium]